jgi:hypothetical protein
LHCSAWFFANSRGWLRQSPLDCLSARGAGGNRADGNTLLAQRTDLQDTGEYLTNSQLPAEGAFTKRMIDIQTDYAIAATKNRAELGKTLVDAKTAQQKVESDAAETASNKIIAVDKVRIDEIADANEKSIKDLSKEEENPTNNIAARCRKGGPSNVPQTARTGIRSS